MRKKYHFNTLSDAELGLRWMKRFLEDELENASKHEAEDIEERIQLMLDEVESLYLTLLEEEPRPLTERVSELWKRMIELNDEEYSHKRNQSQLVWGVWRSDTTQRFDFGYTDETLKTGYVSVNSETKIHVYREIPPEIRWKLNKVVQKEIVFYTACANVAEIEQVSSVPKLPKTMSSEEAGARVLDSRLGQDEWQRRPLPKRIQSISEFVRYHENIIANAPILFVKDTGAVHIDEVEQLLTIRFTDFLSKVNASDFTDHEGANPENTAPDSGPMDHRDLRPIWIIDGQHRIRGLARDPEGAKLTIPIIILPNEFSLSRAAKIFAEINTLQESLKPLHQLYMQHRFKISSPIAKRNFEEWRDKPEPDRDSIANHLCYELLAKLASREGSALFGKVRILDENADKDHYVKADQWVNYARSWFLSTGPYAHVQSWTPEREESVYEEVNNYFQAFIRTVRHDGWKSKDQWPADKATHKSLLQLSTHFQVLINLYPHVYHSVKSEADVFTADDFMAVLKPFRWVDWLDSGLKRHFGGGGERGRSSLFIWMLDALYCEQTHSPKAVMSSTIRSSRGAGILAGPEKSEIMVEGEWPTSNAPVRFRSERPVNARRKPEWSIEDDKGQVKSQAVLTIKGNNECLLEYDSWLDKVKWLKLKVIWSNASSDQATSEIILHKPGQLALHR